MTPSLLFTSLQRLEVIVDDGIDQHELHAPWRQPNFSFVIMQRISSMSTIRMDIEHCCSFFSFLESIIFRSRTRRSEPDIRCAVRFVLGLISLARTMEREILMSMFLFTSSNICSSKCNVFFSLRPRDKSVASCNEPIGRASTWTTNDGGVFRRTLLDDFR